jgi:hypothetical protein
MLLNGNSLERNAKALGKHYIEIFELIVLEVTDGVEEIVFDCNGETLLANL